MTNLRYLHVLSEFAKTPWAIEEEKLRVMEALLMLRAQGGQLNEEEIEARVGGRESQRQPRTQNAVAVLPVYGVINNRMNLMSDMSGGTSIEKLTSQFRDALADPQITGIVFDVDSPGGGVFGVQELADEIFAARGQKKMVAQVNPLAASAAYWLATAADEVAITPSGRAGSIGVFSTHQDISKMLDSEGIKVTLTSAGKYKTEGNQFEPLSDEAKAYLQQSVDQYYAMFVGAVAKGRGVTQANVKAGFGQGRVLSAQDALTAGMVDRIATLDQTLEAMLGAKATSSTIVGARAETIAGPKGPGVKHVESSSTSSEAQPATETPATAETTTEAQMSTAANPAAAAADVSVIREQAAAQIEKDITAIQALARSAGMPDKAAGWLREGKTIDAVLAEINESLKASTAIRVPDQGPQVTLSDKEQKQYSMLRGIRVLCGWDKPSFEHEVSQTIAKKLGKETAGFWMPTNLRMHYDGDRALTALRSEIARQRFEAVLQGTVGQQPGSNLVQTTILPSEFIELLRNMQVCMRLGARKMTDLQGNVQLPKQTAAATLSWTGENPGSAVTATDQTFSNVQMSPKQAMAQTTYSRQFLIQSSLDAEQVIREDHAAIFALGLDLAGLVGSGASNQPKGISNQTGINTVACGTNGGAITYNLIVDSQTALENNNIPIVRPGIATTPGVKGKLRKTARLSNTIAEPIWDDDNAPAGYPGVSTNQLPANLTKGTGTNLHMMIVGDWYQLFFGEWGAMEIIADPYTQAGKGNVVLTPSMLVDVAVRYPQAFTVISDIDPTQ